MINIDDIVKLMLASGVTFAVVGVAFQFMRLLSRIGDVVQDARKMVQNASEVTDMALMDYRDIRGFIRSIGATVADIKQVLGFFNRFSKSSKRSRVEPS